MKRSMLLTGLALAACIEIGACTTMQPSGRQAEVVGTVSLPADAALDQKTVVVISLVDLDRMDVVGQVEQQPSQQRVPFAVTYNRDEIDSSHRYAVEAVVIEEGRPRYKNAPLDPVLTQGNPAQVDVEVGPLD